MTLKPLPFPVSCTVVISFPVGFPPCHNRKEWLVKDWPAGLDWAFAWRFKILRWMAVNPL